MRRFHDQDAYEQREARLVEEILRATAQALQKAGLRGKKLQTITEDIACSVTSAIDGSALMELGDDHLVPVLGFAEGRMRNRLLIPEDGGCSSLHEHVFGISKKLFSDERA